MAALNSGINSGATVLRALGALPGVGGGLEAEREEGLEVERVDGAVWALLGWMVWRGRRGGCMVEGGLLETVGVGRVGWGQ